MENIGNEQIQSLYNFKVNDNDDFIEIRIMNTYSYYSKKIYKCNQFWINNSKYFQDNFFIFKKIIF